MALYFDRRGILLCKVNWNITYKNQTCIYFLGTGTTFDIKDLCAENNINHTALTIDNFIISVSSINGQYHSTSGSVDTIINASNTITKTYSDGILTINGYNASGSWNGQVTVNCTTSAYLVTGIWLVMIIYGCNIHVRNYDFFR